MAGWPNLTHIKLMQCRAAMRTATSADPGVPEVAMSRDGGAEQLFPLLAIARRMLLAPFAIFGLRRSAGKIGEALEIAHVAQCALQSFCRSVQAMEIGRARRTTVSFSASSM